MRNSLKRRKHSQKSEKKGRKKKKVKRSINVITIIFKVSSFFGENKTKQNPLRLSLGSGLQRSTEAQVCRGQGVRWFGRSQSHYLISLDCQLEYSAS